MFNYFYTWKCDLSHITWVLQTRYFAFHGYSFLALDLPGHGYSAGLGLKSMEEMGDWIADVIANEGISHEYESGLNRSTFDVLQSRSNLINAKINLAEAERNYLLAQYKLLKSVGLLNSDYLKLK